MGRYEQSLYKITKYDPLSFTEKEMQECLYGLTQEIPGLWGDPQFIAKGGQAVLVKAYDKTMEVYAAIKFSLPLDTKLQQKKKSVFDFHAKRKKKEIISMKIEFEQRFKRGAKFQSWLYKSAKSGGLFKYGYIPEVYTSPIDNAKLQYAMEYVDAVPIMQWSKRQTSKEVLLDVYLNILLFILHAFHKFGAIHRDLKPDNIMVTATNQPVILDFGLVKMLTEESDVTHETTILGNHKWSSPIQQIASKLCSFKDDVYTLGLLFWSLVTKEIPPYPPAKNKSRVTTWEVFPPNEIPSDLQEFEDFFMKATNDDVDLRYPNLEIAIEGFEQCLRSWHNKKKVTVIEKKVESFSHVNWDKAKEGLHNKKLEQGYKDVLKGMEMLFFSKE